MTSNYTDEVHIETVTDSPTHGSQLTTSTSICSFNGSPSGEVILRVPRSAMEHIVDTEDHVIDRDERRSDYTVDSEASTLTSSHLRGDSSFKRVQFELTNTKEAQVLDSGLESSNPPKETTHPEKSEESECYENSSMKRNLPTANTVASDQDRPYTKNMVLHREQSNYTRICNEDDRFTPAVENTGSVGDCNKVNVHEMHGVERCREGLCHFSSYEGPESGSRESRQIQRMDSDDTRWDRMKSDFTRKGPGNFSHRHADDQAWRIARNDPGCSNASSFGNTAPRRRSRERPIEVDNWQFSHESRGPDESQRRFNTESIRRGWGTQRSMHVGGECWQSPCMTYGHVFENSRGNNGLLNEGRGNERTLSHNYNFLPLMQSLRLDGRNVDDFRAKRNLRNVDSDSLTYMFPDRNYQIQDQPNHVTNEMPNYPENTQLCSNDTRNSSHSKYRKPAEYNGTSSFQDYLVHFELIADMNGWDETTKALELATSLRCIAQGILSDLRPDLRRSYQHLVSALTSRFEPNNQSELYRTQLKTRFRKRGESLAELAQEIKKLLRLAYPLAPMVVREQLARDCFVDAFNDSDMEWAVFQGKPNTVDEALRVALEYEAFQTARRRHGGQRQNVRAHRVNAIERVASPSEQDMSPILGDMMGRLARLESKNNGRPASGSRPNSNLQRKGSCNYCGKEGHWTVDCWKKKNDEARNGQRNGNNRQQYKSQSTRTFSTQTDSSDWEN